MSDGLDLGQHGGQVATGATVIATGVTAALARFFGVRDRLAREETRDKEERARAEAAAKAAADLDKRLALMQQELSQVLAALERQATLAERVAVIEAQQRHQGDLRERLALAEASLKAAHKRLDRSNTEGD